MSHTYAVLPVSSGVFEEIRERLLAAGYGHAIHWDTDGRTVLDMHGIGLVVESNWSSATKVAPPNPEVL